MVWQRAASMFGDYELFESFHYKRYKNERKQKYRKYSVKKKLIKFIVVVIVSLVYKGRYIHMNYNRQAHFDQFSISILDDINQVDENRTTFWLNCNSF